MIRIIRRASIKHAGKRDAKGLYGKYLLSIGLEDDIFSPSSFMLSLADRYDKDCNTRERYAWNTKHIRNCIHKAYGPKKRELDKVRFEIRQADELKKHQEQALDDNVKALGVAIQLKDDVESGKREGKAADIYQRISALQAEQNKIREVIDSINRTEDVHKRKEQSFMVDKRLYSLYRRYDAHIGSLSNKMALKKNQYDWEIHLYWTALMKKLAKKYPTSNKISLKQMTFSDICEGKGIFIRERTEIFQNDQDQIHKKLSEFNIE